MPANKHNIAKINRRWVSKGHPIKVRGERGSYKFMYLTGEIQGEREITAFGGTRNRECWRTFTEDRIVVKNAKKEA